MGSPSIETVGTVTSSAPSVLWSAEDGKGNSSSLLFNGRRGSLVSDPYTRFYAVGIVNSDTIALKVLIAAEAT